MCEFIIRRKRTFSGLKNTFWGFQMHAAAPEAFIKGHQCSPSLFSLFAVVVVVLCMSLFFHLISVPIFYFFLFLLNTKSRAAVCARPNAVGLLCCGQYESQSISRDVCK